MSSIDRSSGKPEYRTTLADRVGMRARSRLFEMCRIVKMPLVEDYRIKRR
jgi:DNA replication protein DnaC